MLFKSEATALSQMTVGDIMTEDVVTLMIDETMDLAETLMKIGRIRHLPVVDDRGILKGLVTHRDLLRVSVSEVIHLSQKERTDILSNIPVRKVMRTELASTTRDTPLIEAAEYITTHKYGCLPVVDDEGVLVGLITEADFVSLTIRLLKLAEAIAHDAD